jgi:DNA-binding NtrC family response regulator
MKEKILVVDDEMAIRKALMKFLAAHDYHVDGASDGAEAIEMVKNEIYDLVISDLKMPNMSGIELIRQVRTINSSIMVIIMTGFGTIESAVEAVKEGAFHYITKPFELDDVAMLVEKALAFRQIKSENEILLRQVKEK